MTLDYTHQLTLDDLEILCNGCGLELRRRGRDGVLIYAASGKLLAAWVIPDLPDDDRLLAVLAIAGAVAEENAGFAAALKARRSPTLRPDKT